VAEKEWLKVAKEFRGLDRRFHVMEKNYGRKRGKSLIGASSVTVTGEFGRELHTPQSFFRTVKTQPKILLIRK